ncbi:ACT domain-containing protein [Clostridium guangxiense]|uniref:ACT domain-containing protein n=1 Tax=Clostridium guangxiense TaxID=1662055 RepID=UPI0038B41204
MKAVIIIRKNGEKKFLLIDSSVLPDVFEEVIKVKEILSSGKVKDITEAVKNVGLSRSTYYKYKDYVFTVSEGLKGHKVTVSFIIGHRTGTLSTVLDKLAQRHANILTINQGIPINNTANVNITFDISEVDCSIEMLLNELKNIENVLKVEILAME